MDGVVLIGNILSAVPMSEELNTSSKQYGF